ncbi:MAG: PAS domain S-box protein [candidate division Zixibacteria bacterium]
MSEKSPDPKVLARKLAELELLLASYREIERELRVAKDFSENLFETANAIVLTLDLNANVTLVNLAAEKITGYSREEIIGKSWMDIFIPASERDTIRKVFADVIKGGGEISGFENSIVTKAGEDKIINWRNNIIRGKDDAAVGVLSVGVDVTESKRSENMLRSTVKGTSATTGRKFFHSLVQHLAEGLGVRAALVGELKNSPNPVITTVAFWDKGKHEDNISYDLAGTPCEAVINQGHPYCYSEVVTQFPKGHVIVDLGIHTYIGTPLVTSDGKPRGILAIMHDKPIAKNMVPDAESLLAVFAARAVAELERVRAEENLRSESEALNQKNIAMSHILEHIEQEREKFREELALKLENLLLPTVKKLRKNKGHLTPKDIDHLEDALKSILNKEIDVFHRNLTRLSGRELQVSEMIRNGISSKEIADKLGISLETVNKHRESIRSKLQITHSKVNLGAYLKSKPWVI